ncbi:MAG: MoxR family ATPase [Sedimenticola sp.]
MKTRIPPGTKTTLPKFGSWPETRHKFGEEVYAIEAALASRRPLLIRGEPGAGKSQLARAAAHQLGWLFVPQVVHSRHEAQDLHCHFDAVGRLGVAQALAAGADKGDAETQLKEARFLRPGPLWWVYDWKSAMEQNASCRYGGPVPERPKEWKPGQGSVLLIDEIDKADADLPNGLLETLGNGAFTVPYLHKTIGSQGSEPPLVVITTNEERELPPAFVRRCLVLNMDLPKEEAALIQHLVARGELHFGKEAGEKCSPGVLKEAAQQLWEDRQAAEDLGVTPPGQAEYLDLLRAVSGMAEGHDEQSDVLNRIKDYALKKSPQLSPIIN